MSATRILVLGVVRWHGRAHGYQVRRDLLTWGADEWANVRPGSIYHALRQMAKEDLLEVVDTEEGSGPDRTVYRLTGRGDEEFLHLVRDALAVPSRVGELLSAAFCFLPVLDRATAISMLKERIATLEGHLDTAMALTAEQQERRPRHIREMFDLWGRVTGTSLEWARELVASLEAGEYHLADDGPGYFGEPGTS